MSAELIGVLIVAGGGVIVAVVNGLMNREPKDERREKAIVTNMERLSGMAMEQIDRLRAEIADKDEDNARLEDKLRDCRRGRTADRETIRDLEQQMADGLADRRELTRQIAALTGGNPDGRA